MPPARWDEDDFFPIGGRKMIANRCATVLSLLLVGLLSRSPPHAALPMYYVTDMGVMSGSQVHLELRLWAEQLRKLRGGRLHREDGFAYRPDELYPRRDIFTTTARCNRWVRSRQVKMRAGAPAGPDAGGDSIGGLNTNMPWAVNSSGTVAGQFNGTAFYSTGGGARSPSPAPPAARPPTRSTTAD